MADGNAELYLRLAGGPPVGPQRQPEPVETATVITQSSHVSPVLDVEDSRSDCTRVYLDAVPLMENQEEQTMVEEADKDVLLVTRHGSMVK